MAKRDTKAENQRQKQFLRAIVLLCAAAVSGIVAVLVKDIQLVHAITAGLVVCIALVGLLRFAWVGIDFFTHWD